MQEVHRYWDLVPHQAWHQHAEVLGGLYCSSSVLAATELVVLVVLGPLLVRARLQDGLQVARAIFAWFVSGLVLRKASPLISS